MSSGKWWPFCFSLSVFKEMGIYDPSHWKIWGPHISEFDGVISNIHLLLTHLIIIIKSEVSTFPLAIFFHGCVLGSGCTIICWRFHIYIYIPGKLGFVSFITVQSYDMCKKSHALWSNGCIRLFAHHTTSLSSLCRPIWRYWTSKMLVR